MAAASPAHRHERIDVRYSRARCDGAGATLRREFEPGPAADPRPAVRPPERDNRLRHLWPDVGCQAAELEDAPYLGGRFATHGYSPSVLAGVGQTADDCAKAAAVDEGEAREVNPYLKSGLS